MKNYTLICQKTRKRFGIKQKYQEYARVIKNFIGREKIDNKNKYTKEKHIQRTVKKQKAKLLRLFEI